MQARHTKNSIQQEDGSFQQHIGLEFKEETSEVLHFEHSSVYGAGNWTGNTCKVLKRGAGEGWKDKVDRSCGK
jgi:hypothetical protein